MTFTPVYENDFTTPLGTEWMIYQGVPKCCPQTLWNKANVYTQGGFLFLKNQRQPDGSWLSGGLSLAHAPVGGNQTYGRWQFRSRFDAGIGIKMVALLWPEAGWPPEIDFAETSTSDTARTNLTATLHYSPTNQMTHEHVTTDLTQWHTCRLDWKPSYLGFYLDGVPWAQITQNVPNQPMHLAIQTEVGLDNGFGSPPNDTTPPIVNLEVSHLKIWSYTP